MASNQQIIDAVIAIRPENRKTKWTIGGRHEINNGELMQVTVKNIITDDDDAYVMLDKDGNIVDVSVDDEE